MNRFSDYPAVIYDANCLIYYCMHCELSHGTNIISVKFPELTDKVQTITKNLTDSRKTIKTIAVVYEEIARKERAGRVVNELITSPQIREQLGLNPGDAFPPLLTLRIIKSLDKKIRGLQGKGWFSSGDFLADGIELNKVKSFYKSLPGQSAPQTTCPANIKPPIPSEQDIHLMLFSVQEKLPILTNDRHFTDFKNDLKTNSFCHEIVGLDEVIEIIIMPPDSAPNYSK